MQSTIFLILIPQITKHILYRPPININWKNKKLKQTSIGIYTNVVIVLTYISQQ